VPFHQDDRDAEASQLFEDALAHGPLVRFLRWGSVSQRESGNYARAVEYMSQTLRFFPNNEDARVGRAVALAKLGLKDWALEELERVVSRGDNSNSYAVRQHVWLLINMTRFEEAEARLLQLLPSEPGNRWVNLELAKLYLYRLRRPEKAKPHIDTLFAKNPDDGAVLLLRLDYMQNTDGRGLRQLAERFILHADESDPEQKSALPRVKAWLATQK
jgi:tetratricopeptide (TPR) repeat protein